MTPDSVSWSMVEESMRDSIETASLLVHDHCSAMTWMMISHHWVNLLCNSSALSSQPPLRKWETRRSIKKASTWVAYLTRLSTPPPSETPDKLHEGGYKMSRRTRSWWSSSWSSRVNFFYDGHKFFLWWW